METEHNREKYPRVPLGKDRSSLRISREEIGIAYRHRQLTGEPIQTFVRRLIREYQLEYDRNRPE